MTNELLLEKLKTQFGSKIIHSEEPYGLLTIEIPAVDNCTIINYLKNDAALQFLFLNDLTAIHYPEETNRELAVVYMLQNMQQGIRIRLKAYIPIQNPSIESVESIYSAANWMERECYDFYGVQFKNHPNLIRIMNVEEMDYFPLRKEYPLEDQTRTDKDDEMFGRTSKN